MMASKILATISKLLVHLVCTGCFLVLAYQSVVKYIDKPTSVSVKYMPITTQKVREHQNAFIYYMHRQNQSDFYHLL